MPSTSRMFPPDLPARSSSAFFSATAVVPAALMGVVLFGLAWGLRDSRQENAALRAELSQLRLAHREAAAHESLAAGAALRVARLEETLALMPPPHDPEQHRAEELERVITFLRGEITAAHEIIDRLKQSGSGNGEAAEAGALAPGNKSGSGL